MAEKNTMSNEQLRRIVVEKMWLNYYNNQLLTQGVITPEQYKKMQTLISSKYTTVKS
jgi:hypothetical protein